MHEDGGGVVVEEHHLTGVLAPSPPLRLGLLKSPPLLAWLPACKGSALGHQEASLQEQDSYIQLVQHWD